MDVSEFQLLIRKVYYDRDRRRGLERTFMWFVEEVGELAEALRRGDGVEEEFADVLAWLASLANLAGVDLGRAAAGKYGRGVCPRCGKPVCECAE